MKNFHSSIKVLIFISFLLIIFFTGKFEVKAQFEAECPSQYPGAQHCPSGYTLVGAQVGFPCLVGFCCPTGYETGSGAGGSPLCCDGQIAYKHILGVVTSSACCTSGTTPQQDYTTKEYACYNSSTGTYSSGVNFFKKSDQQSGYECKKENYCSSGTCWVKCTNLTDKLRCAPSGAQVNQGGTPKYCNGSTGDWVDNSDGLPPPGGDGDGNPVIPPGIGNPVCVDKCGNNSECMRVCNCEQDCGGNPDCNTCCTAGNVWTEIGCISPTQNGVVIAVMRVFMGVVTGLIILRFIQAGFMLNTDDPEKIKEGKNIAVSAVLALVFGSMIIVILNFIGVKVLDIGQIIR